MENLDQALSKFKEIESKTKSLEEDYEDMKELMQRVRSEAVALAVEELLSRLKDYEGEVEITRFDDDGSFIQLSVTDPTDWMMDVFSEFGIAKIGSIDPSRQGHTVVRTTHSGSTAGPRLDLQLVFRRDPLDNPVELVESLADEYDLNLVSDISFNEDIERRRRRLQRLERLSGLLN